MRLERRRSSLKGGQERSLVAYVNATMGLPQLPDQPLRLVDGVPVGRDEPRLNTRAAPR
jgi:hypothetical protein